MKWDLKSINSLRSAAQWIRKGSSAQIVLVIRPQDVAVSVDPAMQAMQAITAIRNELPQLLQYLLSTHGAAKSATNPEAEDP